jgi:hypothetical protein
MIYNFGNRTNILDLLDLLAITLSTNYKVVSASKSSKSSRAQLHPHYSRVHGLSCHLVSFHNAFFNFASHPTVDSKKSLF